MKYLEDEHPLSFTPNKPYGYADALRRLMSDGAFRRSMCEKARLRCNALYTKDRIIARWDELVKQLYAKEACQWAI